MKVNYNNHIYTVGWYYDKRPKPQITECILTLDKHQIARVSVSRYIHDAPDKEKARKYSLTKLLQQIFPGVGNKEIRKLFWESYIHRNEKTISV